MKKNIDELSLELTQEMILESVEKSLPPKLAYRWKKWMEKMKSSAPELFHRNEKELKFENLLPADKNPLKKNEALATFYDNGIIKMDFGSEVDPKLKEAAIKWANKKGLKAVEASLQKSNNDFEFIVFSKNGSNEKGTCLKKVKISKFQ